MAFLELKNYRKKFGENEVLKGISLSLEKGEVLAVIGSSGGGKTTLLRCLNFLEMPDEGELYLGGEKLFDAADKKQYSDAAIREKRLHFGLVFQQFNLFPQYTVFRNITLAQTLLAKELARGVAVKAAQAQVGGARDLLVLRDVFAHVRPDVFARRVVVQRGIGVPAAGVEDVAFGELFGGDGDDGAALGRRRGVRRQAQGHRRPLLQGGERRRGVVEDAAADGGGERDWR